MQHDLFPNDHFVKFLAKPRLQWTQPGLWRFHRFPIVISRLEHNARILFKALRYSSGIVTFKFPRSRC